MPSPSRLLTDRSTASRCSGTSLGLEQRRAYAGGTLQCSRGTCSCCHPKGTYGRRAPAGGYRGGGGRGSGATGGHGGGGQCKGPAAAADRCQGGGRKQGTAAVCGIHSGRVEENLSCFMYKTTLHACTAGARQNDKIACGMLQAEGDANAMAWEGMLSVHCAVLRQVVIILL